VAGALDERDEPLTWAHRWITFELDQDRRNIREMAQR
jgi:hypothetical protein